ncbi:GNAT family N-acetyltransferase [Undibacterium terreum]|uniref:Alanine acetyltransferase n=1 Tax=Undibacterium terreum TaxID=1224302 RepID=A0A916UHZ9_9BURK|nr:GNAT family N-acetyltransferase [Undibacterium terreum]GGC71646.1 alanine acetyltransferase [Undibacterium terreum]
MIVLETERLRLRTISVDDAAFYLELTNDPAWIKNIGDKGLRTVDEARESLLNGPIEMQQRLGFSLYAVERKEDHTALGLCGLIKRDSLEDVDMGYAFLPQFRGKGYAREAAAGVLKYGKDNLNLKRLAAITSPENSDSYLLLEELGFKLDKILVLKGETRQTKLYSYHF